MWFDKEWERLNEYQRAAVEDDSPACLVNANVGSGKTTVLIAKVVYLHVKKQVPYEKMVVLTFTNKAAGEIRERLLALEPDLRQEELEGFGTFHSVALNLLKNRLPLEQMGWNRDFMVITPDEELDMALSLAAEQKLKIKYKNRLKKRLEQEYGEYIKGREESRYGDDLFLLFGALEQEKKRQNKMAFTDLIAVSTQLLRERRGTEGEPGCGVSDCGCGGQSSPDWIIIDEVQDSDRKQLEFVTALKGDTTKLFAVGDPNQLIYSWRGSMETMFYHLKNQFGAKELSLPVNYRSSAAILEASRRFLQFGNEIKGSCDMGSRIVVKNHYDPFQEAQYLAERIRGFHDTGTSYGEMAVFYRLQNQAELLEKVFEKEGIPCEVSQKRSLKDIPALDWLVQVLRFSCCQDDIQAGVAALAHPVYGEGMTKKKARSVLGEKEDSKFCSTLYQRMRGFCGAFGGAETGGGTRDSISGVSVESVQEPVTALIPKPEEVYLYFDLDRYLKPNREMFREERGMVLAFCGKLADYCKLQRKTFPEGTAQFLNSSALYGAEVVSGVPDTPEDSVKLMTLHASKGLEFKRVFIIGVNQGMIPLWGKAPEDEEEERRLFFVGMTRAKDYLELSYYTNPGQPRVAGGPGRFLRMIPEHLLDWEENQSGEEKTANLQQLRKAVRQEQRSAKEEKVKRVRHPKYGEGILVGEDDMMIEAEFENYGKKQFLKAFCEVEMLE